MLPVHVRWMILRDMPEVLTIESEVFEDDAWDGEEFRKWLRQRNCIGVVAEHDDEVVGYCVYEILNTRKRVVLNFVVAPEWRRNGIGRQMAAKLVERSAGPVVFEVSDHDLDAHLFLRAVGFKAVKVVRDYFESGSDLYLFSAKKAKAPA